MATLSPPRRSSPNSLSVQIIWRSIGSFAISSRHYNELTLRWLGRLVSAPSRPDLRCAAVAYIENDPTVLLEGVSGLQIHGGSKVEVSLRNIAKHSALTTALGRACSTRDEL